MTLKKDRFDPHTNFFDLAIVRISFGALSFLALIALSVIIIMSNLKPNFSYEGFNLFLIIFRFPIGLLALLIPVVAVLAANHRSAQTKEQMRLTKKQIKKTQKQIKITTENNAFSNYFKHSEEFEKHIKPRTLEIGITSKNPRKLHRILFPDAKQGVFHISKPTLEKIDADLEIILQASNAFSDSKIMERGTKFLYSIMSSLPTKYNFDNPTINKDIAQEFGTNSANQMIIQAINNFARSIIAALEFDEKSVPTDLLRALSEFNYNTLRHTPLNFKEGVLTFNLRDEVRQIVERYQAEAKMAQTYNQEISASA